MCPVLNNRDLTGTTCIQRIKQCRKKINHLHVQYTAKILFPRITFAFDPHERWTLNYFFFFWWLPFPLLGVYFFYYCIQKKPSEIKCHPRDGYNHVVIAEIIVIHTCDCWMLLNEFEPLPWRKKRKTFRHENINRESEAKDSTTMDIHKINNNHLGHKWFTPNVNVQHNKVKISKL